MRAPPLASDLEEVVADVGALWRDLDGARVLITGGSGFVASWLVATLCHARRELGLRADIVLLTRNREACLARRPWLAEGVLLFAGDVRNFECGTGEFSHVIHAAGPLYAASDPPLEVIDLIVDGARRMAELARRAQTGRFLLLSSGAVYGHVEDPLISEESRGGPDPLNPRAHYSCAKLLAEQIALQLVPRVTVARLFSFVGPYLPCEPHAIAQFLRDGLSGHPIRIHGDGTPMRSYLYASELAVWLWTLLLRGEGGRAYNVGAKEPYTLAAVGGLVARATGSSVVVEGQPIEERQPTRYVPSVLRAERELGLRPRLGLPEALDRTIAWHRGGAS